MHRSLIVAASCLVFFMSAALSGAPSFEELKNKAESGDADAQAIIGVYYHLGEDVEQNLSEAVKWLRKAAEQGHPEAQFNLGICYENGDGVEQNYSEAVNWYLKAAEQGYALAQYNLGRCYEKGIGVEQNYSDALNWYIQSANNGSNDATKEVVKFYARGLGTKQDMKEAVKWVEKAALNGDVEMQLALIQVYGKGEIEKVGQDLEKAFYWAKIAAENGSAEAMGILAVFYGQGVGTEKNEVEAKRWFAKGFQAKMHEGAAKAQAERQEKEAAKQRYNQSLTERIRIEKGDPDKVLPGYEFTIDSLETHTFGSNKLEIKGKLEHKGIDGERRLKMGLACVNAEGKIIARKYTYPDADDFEPNLYFIHTYIEVDDFEAIDTIIWILEPLFKMSR